MASFPLSLLRLLSLRAISSPLKWAPPISTSVALSSRPAAFLSAPPTPPQLSSSRNLSSPPPPPPPSCLPMEQQFEEFRSQLDESGAVREKLRAIVAELDTATRLMHAQLLLVHHSRPSPEILDKAKAHINTLKSIYGQLAEVIKVCPGQYYRYHDLWRNQTYTAVFLLVFVHWLETSGLLSHRETEALLGLNQEEFGLDLEDYLVGLCGLSSELPRYVVNQVTAGDYDCPQKASVFLSDLYAAFRILNLRNDLLRKRFDGMKFDLKKVEEVLYDVKIRGLLSGSGKQVPPTKASRDLET